MDDIIYNAYHKLKSDNYTKEEIKPLIERVYLIALSIIKGRRNGNGETEAELKETAINITADFFISNSEGNLDLLIAPGNNDFKQKIDLEYSLYKQIVNLCE